MKKYFLLLISLFLLNACDELEEVGSLTQTTLNGQWQLQNVSCFCNFDNDYDFTTTTLEINLTDSTATFQHSEDTFINDQGVYTYTIKNNEISFDNEQWYMYSIEDDTLSLVYVDDPEIADDEISYTFVKK